MSDKQLLKISALARESGVPVATVKHYVREGLIVPARVGRNIAHYWPSDVERIQRIKALQQRGFLPLKVIREQLERAGADAVTVEESVVSAIRNLESGSEGRTRSSLLAAGVDPAELDWLEGVGAVSAIVVDGEPTYRGEDLELLRTLGAARKAGLTREMLPLDIVGRYVSAIRELVSVEVDLFQHGVVPRAGENLAAITDAATKLSERLVVLLRRRMLVPMLRELSRSTSKAPPRGRKPGSAQPERARAKGPKRARRSR
ncbi:MAG: MerR family transcriptional regulator [Polyangiaceae bacterium]